MNCFFKKLASVVSILCLTACANPYKAHYAPLSNITAEELSRVRAAPPTEDPRVEYSLPIKTKEQADESTKEYLRRGYERIGYSSFREKSGATGAREQAIEVGADLVVIHNPEYAGSVTVDMPLILPVTSSSYSTLNATAYGPRGITTIRGNSTTYTQGSSTTYVPVTNLYYDYLAQYFIKFKPAPLGVYVKASKLGDAYHAGVVVDIVRQESPADLAGVREGDTLLSIDGVWVVDVSQFVKLVPRYSGRTVEIEVLRQGTSSAIMIPVHLN